jgi:hypothetical protein
VNSRIGQVAIDVAIRDEYEKRRQAMESELRADMRQIRSEMSSLRKRMDEALDCRRCVDNPQSPMMPPAGGTS